eukprot:11962406-Alexandrium_andersonii.AAC.1
MPSTTAPNHARQQERGGDKQPQASFIRVIPTARWAAQAARERICVDNVAGAANVGCRTMEPMSIQMSSEPG